MYRVDWLESASDELAELWIEADASLRQDLTRASHEIEQRLSRSPNDEGESRPNGRRLAFEPPLMIVFAVHEAEKAVVVAHVRLMRRRKP